MIGFVLSTVSPSSSIISRSTPWVDGCWGPMLMIIVSSSPHLDVEVAVGGADAFGQPQDRTDLAAQLRRRRLRRESQLLGAFGGPGHEGASCSGGLFAGRSRSSRPGRLFELHRDPPDAVVLAQRVTLPVLGHEDPREVRVALEDDPEHVERLALHRLRTRDRDPRANRPRDRSRGPGPAAETWSVGAPT